ncbi:MAG: SGNH/GDSL hydrolase family protein [Cyanobacterium sp. T60_A2020_053]|nr:SGNH/GDSL hydrolase family protein [Cyanobacterium sp. T60_A2020_053]
MIKLILTGLILVFITVEITLRLIWGFGNPLIYIRDKEIGYLLAPNQTVKRNGNLIKINSFSMRSNELKDKNEDNLRILLLGDSIVNGGWWTDQNQTISSLLQTLFIAQKTFFNTVEVLNVSANSWGARNELAYLHKYGIFNSNILVLVLNTDDLFAFKPSSEKVGKTANYFEYKPLLALQELYQKIYEKFFPPHYNFIEKGDIVQFNLDAVKSIQDFTIKNNCKFFLVLTPLKRETVFPYSKEYELKARARLEDLVMTENIKYLDFLPVLKDNKNLDKLYHDHIHFNTEGNQFIAEKILAMLNENNII